MKIHADVKIEKNLIPKIYPSLARMIIKEFRKTSLALVSYLREKRFTGGTTSTRLAVRSGKLRASVRAKKIVQTPQTIEAGVDFGTEYARTHVGPKGQVTTIRPVRAKMLAIPLPAALKPSGVPKGAPRTGPWGDTFIAKTRSGNLMIFGKKAYSKGARQGQTHGKIVPLFLLKDEVKVKARVHPSEIIGFASASVLKGLRSSGLVIQ